MRAPPKEQDPIQTEKTVDEYHHTLTWNVPHYDLSARGQEMKDSLEELKQKLKRQADSYSF